MVEVVTAVATAGLVVEGIVSASDIVVVVSFDTDVPVVACVIFMVVVGPSVLADSGVVDELLDVTKSGLVEAEDVAFISGASAVSAKLAFASSTSNSQKILQIGMFSPPPLASDLEMATDAIQP